MSKVKVLLFATLRQHAGANSVEIEFREGMKVRELKDELRKQHPNLRESLESVLIAINHEYAFDEDVVPASGEIALFPPVSGG